MPDSSAVLSQRETAPAAGNRWQRLVGMAVVLTVLTTLTGKLSYEVAGFSVRLEHLTTLILAAIVFAHRDGRAAAARSVRHPVVLVFAAFLAWGALASLLFSPSFLKSAAILGWLGLDLLLLTVLLATGPTLKVADRLSGPVCIAWAVVGFAAFTVANATQGWFGWGTNFEYAHNLHVTALTAFESNIYATILVLWTLLYALGRRLSWRMIGVTAIVFPLGLLAAQTRASFAALVAGCGLFMAYTAFVQYRNRRIELRAFAAPIMLMIGAGVVTVMFAVVTGLFQSEEPKTVELRDPAGAWVVTVPANPGETEVGLNKLYDLEEADAQGSTIDYRKRVLEIAASDMDGWNLLIGNGVNTFPLRHDRPAEYGPGEGALSMLPAQVLYDSGIVGLLLFCGLLVTVIVCTPASRRPLAVGILAAFFVASALTSVLWFSITWIMIAVLLRPEDAPETEANASV